MKDDWPFVMLSLLRFLVMMQASKPDAELPFVTIMHLLGQKLKKHTWPSTEGQICASWRRHLACRRTLLEGACS